MTDVVINLLETKEFTEEHRLQAENLLDWELIYPEIFGDKLPDAIEYVGLKILPLNAVDWSVQKYRAGGRTRNSKLLDIKQNIERNGYKLKYPAMAWFQWSPTDFEVITGNSRGEVTSGTPFNMPNGIIAVFKGKEGYTKAQVQDAIEMCGIRFNSIHDPAEPLSKADVYRNVVDAIQRYIDTDGEAGVPNTMDAITERVDWVCGEGVFQPHTRQTLILQIYNNFNAHDIVVPWSTRKEATFQIAQFMTDAKLVDTDTVKYIPISHDRETFGFYKAVQTAAQYPNAEIRMVVHTGTLSGFDFDSVFQNRLATFVTRFNGMIMNACIAFFGKTAPEFNRVKIYAALPALGRSHDLTKPFFFNARTDTFYQKNEDNAFSVVDGEEEEYDEAA
jgi:hypothetical protein